MFFHRKIIGTSWGKHMYTTSNELEKDKEAWTTGYWLVVFNHLIILTNMEVNGKDYPIYYIYYGKIKHD